MSYKNEAEQMELNFDDVEDNLGDEDEVVPVKYSITSYGADYVVATLVKFLDDEEIYIPHFQRKFIWNMKQCSRFIESLLLGLPVPSIFLSRDEERKHLVIDGQQRLRSIQSFYDGIFPDTGREFALRGVQVERFEGKTYKTLDQEDRRQLDNSILHAIIIQQDEPSDDNSSVYYIFERLNTTGTPLTSQEIRATIYRGELNQLLEHLNENLSWRSIYGPVNKRRRDQEFILRFLALYFDQENYSSPMKGFLNDYMIKNRHLRLQSAREIEWAFENAIDTIYEHIGANAFRLTKSFNAAVFDSVMVGVAHRLEKGAITDGKSFHDKYYALIRDETYLDAIETGTTASVSSVTNRITEATKAFDNVE